MDILMAAGGLTQGSAATADAQGDSVSAMRAPRASLQPSKAQCGQAELYPSLILPESHFRGLEGTS